MSIATHTDAPRSGCPDEPARHTAAAWRLPAEWEPQDGVLLAWPPDSAAGWQPVLQEIRGTVAAIAAAVSHRERVILTTTAPDEARRMLDAAGARLDRVELAVTETDDIWARDFGPLTVVPVAQGGRKPCLLDFTFNGWGGKARCARDNEATARLHAAGCFGDTARRTMDLAFEGGSVDTDGRGTLLTTDSCLLNPNRNPQLGRAEIEAALMQAFGLRRVLWLHHGWLAGDDTDGHVDMLARLAPDDTILYTACDDPADEHAAALHVMANELRALRTLDARPYRLLPLPWPRPMHDPSGNRMPASYANFLVINGAVLVPSYGDVSDAAAQAVVAQAFPGRAIIGIDATTPIRQHGSLHCLTMQLPQGVLNLERAVEPQINADGR